MEKEHIVITIKPISFRRRFLTIFLPNFIAFLCIIAIVDYFDGRHNSISLLAMALLTIIFAIRGVMWSKNYIIKISIFKNIVEITMKKYNKDVVHVFSLKEIRAVVSKAVPKGGRYQLFISQKVNKENILQYEMVEWTKDNLETVAQTLTDTAKNS